MNVMDVLAAPWAIRPERLEQLKLIYKRHLRGEATDIEVLRKVTEHGPTQDPAQNNAHPAGKYWYATHDGVALFAVHGIIARRMNLFMQICGGVSTELLGRDIQAALADPQINALVLDVDSPGGTADGSAELTSLLYQARGVKPILACASGEMCSAAYWIGSAADQVFASSEVAIIGSIGVVMTHLDRSGTDASQGIKVSEIYAGKYKRIASSHAPLNDEGRAYIQSQVDRVYSVFVQDVARNRAVSVEEALARMADGRVFCGSQAVEHGLADAVATLEETVRLAREMTHNNKISFTKHQVITGASRREHSMDISTLQAQHPEIYETIRDQAAQEERANLETQVANAREEGRMEGLAAGRVEGAQAERERIQAVRAQSLPGHEALIEQLAFDGITTAEQAASQVLAAERNLRQQTMTNITKESNPPVPPAASMQGNNIASRDQWDQMDAEQQRAFLARGGKIINRQA